MNMIAKHVYDFLNDFEKLCLKHNVKFDHLNVKLLEGGYGCEKKVITKGK